MLHWMRVLPAEANLDASRVTSSSGSGSKDKVIEQSSRPASAHVTRRVVVLDDHTT